MWLRIEGGDKFRTSDCGFALLPSNSGEKRSRQGLAQGCFTCFGVYGAGGVRPFMHLGFSG